MYRYRAPYYKAPQRYLLTARQQHYHHLHHPSAANEVIIPNTVPNRPRRVATDAIVERNTRFFSKHRQLKRRSFFHFFLDVQYFLVCIQLCFVSIISLYLRRPAFITLPTLPLCLSHSAIAWSTFLLAR